MSPFATYSVLVASTFCVVVAICGGRCCWWCPICLFEKAKYLLFGMEKKT